VLFNDELPVEVDDWLLRPLDPGCCWPIDGFSFECKKKYKVLSENLEVNLNNFSF
jgi:hypothetical protein